MDAEAPLGVPALKTLCDEMTARNHLIKVIYENAENGVVMPNIPQMGRFWTSMGAAFEIATNGGATPEVALQVPEEHGKVTVNRFNSFNRILRSQYTLPAQL